MRSILKMTGERRKYIAFTLIVVFVTASMAVVISLYHPEGSEPPCMTTTSNNVIATNALSSSNGLSKYPNGQQPYLDVPKVYASLSYPRITYDNYDTSYLPSEPNFTLEYRTKDAGFHVGTVQAPAISLKKAVELAADYAKLNPSSYNLGEAVFVPGTVFNSTLIAWPQWFLYFAEIHDGYWIYGNHGPYALSLELFVNAMSGAVARMDGDTVNPTNPGQYELSVNSSRALKTVRQSNLPGVPAALTENGTVSFIEPRVVIPGLSPNSRWLDSSLSGQSRLLWIIELDYSNFGGTFAVDAGSGALAGGTAGVGIENPLGGSYYGSIAFSTAKNL